MQTEINRVNGYWDVGLGGRRGRESRCENINELKEVKKDRTHGSFFSWFREKVLFRRTCVKASNSLLRTEAERWRVSARKGRVSFQHPVCPYCIWS